MKESIIERVVRLVKEGGFKEKELCNYVGISQSTFVNWKNRGTNPDAINLSKMAEFLNVSLDYLVKGIEKEKSYKIDDELENCIELLHKDRRYRVLLDSSKKLDKEALEQLIAFIDKINPQQD